MNIEQFDWRVGAGIGAAAVVAVGVLMSQWLRRAPDPDETERKRRSYVNQVGRIVEGHIIQLIEEPASDGGGDSKAARNARKLVCYSYSISGVSYETAQDLTGLENRVPLDRLVAGQSASVKYDPAHPANSILLADDWSGLH